MSGATLRGFLVATLIGIAMTTYGIQAADREGRALEAASAVTAQGQLRVHTDEVFSFVANARLADVFPLFGAERERLWAPGWEPRFVWPTVPTDRAGMVFRVARGDRLATWVNTVFDSNTGRVQYVYVMPEVVATVITLDVHSRGDTTEVVVRYERTSLTAASDATVKAMAAQDRAAGPEWAAQINSYLAESGHR
jgi:hypothetical protein